MDSVVEAKLNIDAQTPPVLKVDAKPGARGAHAKATNSLSIVLMEHPAAGSTTSKRGAHGGGSIIVAAPAAPVADAAPASRTKPKTTLGTETKISTGRSEMWKKAISLSPPPSLVQRQRGKEKGSSTVVSAREVPQSTTTKKPVADTKFADKFGTTVTRAKQIGGVIIQSKLLVAVLVFLSTALLLILLNPPMAQEIPDGESAAINQRSWRKIMIWSSLACVFALILPYTCGRGGAVTATGNDDCAR